MAGRGAGGLAFFFSSPCYFSLSNLPGVSRSRAHFRCLRCLPMIVSPPLATTHCSLCGALLRGPNTFLIRNGSAILPRIVFVRAACSFCWVCSWPALVALSCPWRCSAQILERVHVGPFRKPGRNSHFPPPRKLSRENRSRGEALSCINAQRLPAPCPPLSIPAALISVETSFPTMRSARYSALSVVLQEAMCGGKPVPSWQHDVVICSITPGQRCCFGAPKAS